ncbi:serine hydrolase domain-containing protein [Ruania alba]|uniref:CubicO group peptidase, beta-lactamase class C family n=1 Tax=Ruania alba TaxID=648782 RepID=A0A1H5L5Q0_9MICO|nr:serine hydrolase domain-containing protein [Ruania alba]SEE71641.1 CubicO group peptidase, beta-lactamase class C family [Ruania alba]
MTGDDLLAPATAAVTAERAGAHAPPGASFAVLEGNERHVAVSGTADLRTGEALTESHVHDLASVSKVLTTLTLRRLFVDGALSATDTLGHVLGTRAGSHADVTLDEVLRHRAGFVEWRPLYLVPGVEEDPAATSLSTPPRYAPGSGRHYSDLGMQALGAVIARTASMPFAAAVRHLLLDPLGASSVTAGAPPDGSPSVAGADGDAIEREMVRSGVPYPVDADADAFHWRTETVRGAVGDGNAFHAFRGAAGHAGWFADADGLLRIAAALADPERYGLGSANSLAATVDAGQGQGVLVRWLPWRGRDRLFLGHGGFTGTFIAAAPATEGAPEVLTVLLTNRLHGRPGPGRGRLVPSETLWRGAMSHADTLLHPTTTGDRP